MCSAAPGLRPALPSLSQTVSVAPEVSLANFGVILVLVYLVYLFVRERELDEEAHDHRP